MKKIKNIKLILGTILQMFVITIICCMCTKNGKIQSTNDNNMPCVKDGVVVKESVKTQVNYEYDYLDFDDCEDYYLNMDN